MKPCVELVCSAKIYPSYTLLLWWISLAIKYFSTHDTALFDLIKPCFPFLCSRHCILNHFWKKTIWMWLFHRHPILVCYTSLNHQVNWMKRESREKAFTDLQYLRIWNRIRVLLVASKMSYALQSTIINCKKSTTISCLNYTFYAK